MSVSGKKAAGKFSNIYFLEMFLPFLPTLKKNNPRQTANVKQLVKVSLESRE